MIWTPFSAMLKTYCLSDPLYEVYTVTAAAPPVATRFCCNRLHHSLIIMGGCKGEGGNAHVPLLLPPRLPHLTFAKQVICLSCIALFPCHPYETNYSYHVSAHRG